ncbi:MAG: hypothetical protein GF405_09770 [Candidatus Eisenbacteria bacterium]|nr:hypothetical protein [Candidatus Eisenbacteria bacterium]
MTGKSTFRTVARIAAAVTIVAVLSGCAGPGARFEDRIGVPVNVTVADSISYGGTLVGMRDGALLVDREIPKSDDLVVVRSGGTDFVESGGRVLGTAVLVRDFDVLVRQSVPPEAVSDLELTTRAYFGWGTGIAAVLAFALVLAIEDI